jgi:hypothetical protein
MLAIRAVGLSLLVALSISAAAQDALQRELSDSLRSYFTAVNGGKVKEALSLRTASSRAEIEKELADAKNRTAAVEMLKAMTPERFEVQHFEATPAGAEATLYVLATKTFSPEVAKQQGRQSARAEAMAQFRKEGNSWRLDNLTLTGDPDRIKRSPDETYEREAAFNMERRTSINGRVVRTRFENDHTVVIVRVLDEEIVALLPPRKELEEYKFDFDTILPWRIVNVQGHLHKSNPLKLFATSLRSGS